jgi:hypothetical protein
MDQKKEFEVVARYLREPLQAVVLIAELCDLIVHYLLIRIEKIIEKSPRPSFHAFSIRPFDGTLFAKNSSLFKTESPSFLYFYTIR